MSKRRIQILQGDLDQQSIDWLNAQTNMSASIRLLIYQASRQGAEDYVMKCAKQASGIFTENGTPVVKEPQVNKSNEFEPEVSSPWIPDEKDRLETTPTKDVPYIEETEIIDETEVEEIPVDEPTVDVNEAVDETSEAPTEIDWEEEEIAKQNRIERMMQDLGRN